MNVYYTTNMNSYPFIVSNTLSTLVHMENLPNQKYILINTGPKTRQAFLDGLASSETLTVYQSKKLLLHIKADTQQYVYGNTPVDLHAKYIFIRLRGSDSHFCGMLSDYCTHNDIKTNDPIHRSYKNSAGKISQMLFLSLHNIQIPESFIFREESFRKNEAYIEEHLSFPAVYKTDGSKGTKVHRVENMDELRTHVQNKKPEVLALAQPFIENTFDTRTLVFKSEFLGTISRTRPSGFLNNISQGAKAAAYTLTEEEANIAIRAAQACRIDFAGIDMIHTKKGPVVLEVNKSPQIAGFESVYDFKVLTRIAEIIDKMP